MLRRIVALLFALAVPGGNEPHPACRAPLALSFSGSCVPPKLFTRFRLGDDTGSWRTCTASCLFDALGKKRRTVLPSAMPPGPRARKSFRVLAVLLGLVGRPHFWSAGRPLYRPAHHDGPPCLG